MRSSRGRWGWRLADGGSVGDRPAAEQPLAYLRGHLVPAAECKLPIYDLGIVLGAAVTDFLRTFRGEPYRLEDHAQRFYRSCRYARIDPPISLEETMQVSRDLVEHNRKLAPGSELGLVYYMTAGENPIYAGSAGVAAERTPTYVQHTFPMPFHLWRPLFIEGARCITPSVRHWPPQSLSSAIKHRNRLHMWIGDQEAHLADPDAIAVYLDQYGYISETGGANFVIYRDGRVTTPKRGNILWGISLTVLGEILAELGVPLVEADIHPYDVVNADEAWLPTTPYCLAPVVRFNGAPVGDGTPGQMWRRLIDRWSSVVGTDIYAELADAKAP